MTFAEMQTLTSVILDDTSNGYFTVAQIKVWLNNAQREAQKLLMQAGQNYYVTCAQTTLVPSQQDYVLPSDFLKEHRLELILGGTYPNEDIKVIQSISINQQDLLANQTGQAQGFYLRKDRLVIVPIPDIAYTLRLTYSYKVADMVNDVEVADVPLEYHELLPNMAARDGFIRDRRDTSTLDAKIKYYIDLMKADSADRVQDQGRMIITTQDPGFGALF